MANFKKGDIITLTNKETKDTVIVRIIKKDNKVYETTVMEGGYITPQPMDIDKFDALVDVMKTSGEISIEVKNDSKSSSKIGSYLLIGGVIAGAIYLIAKK